MEAERLQVLISDLLDLSEIESREGRAPLANVDLAAAVWEVIAQIHPLAEKKSVTLPAIGEGPLSAPTRSASPQLLPISRQRGQIQRPRRLVRVLAAAPPARS
jgi:signal transduction histidine kinase